MVPKLREPGQPTVVPPLSSGRFLVGCSGIRIDIQKFATSFRHFVGFQWYKGDLNTQCKMIEHN